MSTKSKGGNFQVPRGGAGAAPARKKRRTSQNAPHQINDNNARNIHEMYNNGGQFDPMMMGPRGPMMPGGPMMRHYGPPMGHMNGPMGYNGNMDHMGPNGQMYPPMSQCGPNSMGPVSCNGNQMGPNGMMYGQMSPNGPYGPMNNGMPVCSTGPGSGSPSSQSLDGCNPHTPLGPSSGGSMPGNSMDGNVPFFSADEKVYPPDIPLVPNPQTNAPPIYPCGVCRREVRESDQAILCESGCNFWFHRSCSGLAEAAFHMLIQEFFAEWVCDTCIVKKNVPLIKFKP